ncbi:MAG TPA: hypothetical protein PJ982_06800 [Lacipirellulaceae bacterium]|nr:hypothetical protein [Lacipirellulaceae bacterium]
MSKPAPSRPDPSAGQKPSASAPTPRAKPVRAASPWPWGLGRRIAVSVLVSLHVAAVFSAPWFLSLRTDLYALPPRDAQGRTIEPQVARADQLEFETPVMAELLARFFSHYNNLLFLNNGYEFFSPDPVWSHLIEYTIFDAAGEEIDEGRFPDRRTQWPRLFYHRHMMLAEQSGDPEMVGAPDFIADWLLERTGGERITLRWVRHHLLRRKDVLDGKSLSDKSTYEVIGEVQRRRSERPGVAGSEQIGIPGGAR